MSFLNSFNVSSFFDFIFVHTSLAFNVITYIEHVSFKALLQLLVFTFSSYALSCCSCFVVVRRSIEGIWVYYTENISNLFKNSKKYKKDFTIYRNEKKIYALTKIFSYKTSRSLIIRLYMAIKRSTLVYACKAWMTERRLRTFENKVWRKICAVVSTQNWGQAG